MADRREHAVAPCALAHVARQLIEFLFLVGAVADARVSAWALHGAWRAGLHSAGSTATAWAEAVAALPATRCASVVLPDALVEGGGALCSLHSIELHFSALWCVARLRFCRQAHVLAQCMLDACLHTCEWQPIQVSAALAFQFSSETVFESLYGILFANRRCVDHNCPEQCGVLVQRRATCHAHSTTVQFLSCKHILGLRLIDVVRDKLVRECSI
jgi:predicted RNA-binding Zn-ribbon protein involved in translation (DUF1610 family)